MRYVMKAVGWGLVGAVVAGCGDTAAVTMVTAPTAQVITCEDDPTQPGCEEPPPPPPPPPSLPPWLGPVVNEPYEAPSAPGSSSTGIWLGSAVTPSQCFAHLSTTPIADHDSDYLADHCELELAKGFAPTMKFDPGDYTCSNGEPYWAAKYFMNGVVRIAYLPAYYEDCGWPDGSFISAHQGDSEFIMVEAEFDASKQRWVMREMFLSAHLGTSGDQSEWVKPADAQWGFKVLGNPIVWVAKWKHGNFKSKFTCDTLQDDCSSFPTILRFPVYANRNVGSRTSHVGCVGSTVRYPGSGRTECFYESKTFRGWHPVEIFNGAGKYRDMLMSPLYERRCGVMPSWPLPDCSALSDWGPDPSAPAYLYTLSGPGYMYEGGYAVTATRSPGTPAGLHYEWQYIHCSDPDHAACQAYPWSTFAQGIDVMSIYDFIGRTDQFREYRIRIRAYAGGPVLHTTAIHRVVGGGESANCPPENNFCLQELREGSGRSGAPAPRQRKPPLRRGAR